MRNLQTLSFAVGLTALISTAHAETPVALVDLTTYIRDLLVSKPYATEDNFTGNVVYPPNNPNLTSRCEMKPSSAEKLKKGDVYLKEHSDGARFLAYDCYRPAEAQTLLWNAWGCPANPSKCSGYIAAPGRSKHNLGAAMDGFLADKNGIPLEAPTAYDNFTPLAHPSSIQKWTPVAQKNWLLYRDAMLAAGCVINPSEWWHVDC